MHRIPPALGFAAVGFVTAAFIALAISSDLFGALALGSAAPSRPLVVEQGGDVSQVPTTQPPDDVVVPTVAPPRIPARRPTRVARATPRLPPPSAPEAPPVTALPPLPAPLMGVAAIVPPG